MSGSSIREEIERRRFGPAMKRALARLLDGDTYRAAAEAEGVDWRSLHWNAGHVDGLREARLIAWRDACGDSFPPLWQHHLRGLD